MHPYPRQDGVVVGSGLDVLASAAAEASGISDKDLLRDALVTALPSSATQQQIDTVRSLPRVSDLDIVDAVLDADVSAKPHSKSNFRFLKSRGWIRIKTARPKKPGKPTHYDNYFLNPRGGVARTSDLALEDEVRSVFAFLFAPAIGHDMQS
jgi:hypothetical protein